MPCRRHLIVAGIFFLLAPVASLVPSSYSERSLADADTPQEREMRNRSAIGVILGEFRTNLSDLIFIKTERYLDSGVAYAPHLDAAEMASSGEIKTRSTDNDHETSSSDSETTNVLETHLTTPAMREVAGLKPGQIKSDEHEGHEDHEGHDHAKHDDHEGHDHGKHEDHEGHDHAKHEDHEGHDHGKHEDHHDHAGHDHEVVPTIIRTADRDFRGFIGNLERNVKPWRDPKEPHKHTAGTELLPWYRLATISDPHNIRNYIVGSWWLKTLQTPQQTQEALAFLEEGIRHNPQSFQLYLMKGYVLRQLKHSRDAGASFEKAAELALKVRPRDGKLTKEWDVLSEEQATAAIIMTVYSHRDDYDTTKALETAKMYRDRFPSDDKPFDRVITRLEKILASGVVENK